MAIGTRPGDERAEDEDEHDERDRQPERELAVLQVTLRERVDVVRDRAVAGDRDREVRGVDAPDERHHRRDRLVAVDPQLDDRRVPARSDERPVTAEVVPRDSDIGPGRERLPGQPRDEAAKRGSVDGVPLGADHDHVADGPLPRRRGRRKRAVESRGRLRRLGVAADVALRAETERGDDEHERDSNGDRPARKRAHRMTGAGPSKPLRPRDP